MSEKQFSPGFEMEERICELDRLIEASVQLFGRVLERPFDKSSAEVAMTVLEVTRDRMRGLKGAFYAEGGQ